MSADRIRTFAGFLRDMEREWSDTPNQNWLRDNAAAIRREHAAMLAEREQEERA